MFQAPRLPGSAGSVEGEAGMAACRTAFFSEMASYCNTHSAKA
tara:strand:- start:384 stop:512 length:129 start_codon:yes stop_codon:yes gene_type:complete